MLQADQKSTHFQMDPMDPFILVNGGCPTACICGTTEKGFSGDPQAAEFRSTCMQMQHLM